MNSISTDQGTARCDFPNGSAEHLWDSIQSILSLPKHTRVFVGHDYQPGGREIKFETTVEDEIKHNIHVKEGVTREHFLKTRKERDATLTQPKLIIPSIQVNINAGVFPKPEANGVVYLKWPVNLLAKEKGETGVTSRVEDLKYVQV